MYVCVCAHMCVHVRVRVHVFVHLYMRLCVCVCHGERDKVSVFACVRAHALKEDCREVDLYDIQCMFVQSSPTFVGALLLSSFETKTVFWVCVVVTAIPQPSCLCRALCFK